MGNDLRKLLASALALALSLGVTYAQTPVAPVLSIPSGGTGAKTAPLARANLGAAQSGVNADITTLTANGLFQLIAPDGSIQLEIYGVAGATEFIHLQGSHTNSGGAIICLNITLVGNVNCSITAMGAGKVNLSNGNGKLLSVIDPGTIASGPVNITAPTATNPGNIDCNGAPCQMANATIITDADMQQLWALNTNPDFWFDDINNSTLTTATSGQVVDGWRVTASQSGKLSFQRVAASVTGYSNAEQINAVAGAYSSISTDNFQLATNLNGGDAKPLNWGQSYASPMAVQVCVNSNGLTLPFNLPWFAHNNNAGSVDRSYIHLIAIASAGWQCFRFTVPGDTTASAWYGVTSVNFISVGTGVDLGSGSNFQAPSVDTWNTGKYRTAAGAGSLVAASAAAYIQVSGVEYRPGSWPQHPYYPLPYTQERARALARFYTTFPIGTKPQQNSGITTGEYTYPATVAGTGINTSPLIPLGGLIPNQVGNAVTTFYNPAAANAHCRDETTGVDGGIPTVVSLTQSGLVISCAGATGGAVGDRLGVHITVDNGQ